VRFICDHFTELHYNTVEVTAIFITVSISVNICLAPLNKRVYVRPLQVYLLPLQLLAHGALQCLVIPVIVSLLAVCKQIAATSVPCGEGGEAVHPNYVMASVVRTPNVSWRSREGEIIQKCFSWGVLDERKHSNFLLLILAARYRFCCYWGRILQG
jgi:hypothetical protein